VEVTAEQAESFGEQCGRGAAVRAHLVRVRVRVRVEVRVRVRVGVGVGVRVRVRVRAHRQWQHVVYAQRAAECADARVGESAGGAQAACGVQQRE